MTIAKTSPAMAKSQARSRPRPDVAGLIINTSEADAASERMENAFPGLKQRLNALIVPSAAHRNYRDAAPQQES
jgi:hypothetical protein